MVLFGFVWFLNLGISFWNAYAVGNAWVESRHAGGWRRFIAWMGAAMADIGFTWCSLILFGLIANQVGWLNDYSFEILLNLGYVMIIPVLLFAGYAIMLDSWQRAYRQRSLTNMGFAGWNTFANIHNTYNAVNGFGDAFGKVIDGFFGGSKSKNKDSAQAMLILFLLVLAIGLGTMVTYAIINRYAARDEPLPSYSDRQMVQR